jgi:hypothetical protein
MVTRLNSRSSLVRSLIAASVMAALLLIGQAVPKAHAAGTLTFDPAALAFSASIATYTDQVPVTVTNSGDAPVNIIGMGSLTGNFPYTNIDCPFGTLDVGASCTITVGYFATVIGEQTGSFNIWSDAPGSPAVLPITGTGLVLYDGSFEVDAAAPALLPDAWKGSNLRLSASQDGQDCTSASEGACSMRFIGDGNGSKIKQDAYMHGDAGDTLTLTFDSRAQSVGGSGAYRVKMQVFHVDGSKKTYKLNLPTASHDWTERTLIVTALKDYNMIRLTIQFTRNAGTVWFDDFLLERN